MKQKNINEYLKEDFLFMCKRLKEIRLELRSAYDGKVNADNPYTQANMAAYIGIKPANLVNLESKVITYNTFKLITIYQSYGYNPDWILTEENDFISKKRMQNNIVVKSNVREDFKKLERDMLTSLQEFKETL